MKIDLNRFRETFFEEASEHLATMEAALLRLEAAPDNAELLNEVFRAAHSMKGGSGTLGLSDLSEVTHALESLLDCVRSRGLRATPLLIDLLLRARDLLVGLLAAARTDGPPPADKDALQAELERALEAANAHRSAPSDPAEQSAPSSPIFAISFAPNVDLFRRGMDPLLLLRDLAGLGTLLKVQPDLSALPSLGDLDPTNCHLSWAILLRTEQPRSAVEAVFEFVRDDCRRLSIEILSEIGVVSAEGPRPRFFGVFLVENGLATPEQILDVLDRQHKNRPRLGRLALDAGMMTAHQVFDVLNQMGPLGLRFGETALQLGYLSEVDLARLRLRQGQSMPLGEALVQAGILPREQMQAALEAYRSMPEPVAAAEAPPSQVAPSVPDAGDEWAPSNVELLSGFCPEAEEHLEAADRLLLTLDSNPTCKETLNAIYRAFHSIKGVASMFDLKALVSLAHGAEDLLNCARDGTLELRGGLLDLAFASADGLKRQVGYVRDWLAVGSGPLQVDPELPVLLARLRAALSGGHDLPSAPASPEPAAVVPTSSPEGAPAIAAATSQQGGPPAGGMAPSAEKETVRVDRGRLDKLINSIGELVIAQSMVQQEMDERMQSGFHSRALPELCKIARDLQELSLSLRMVPLQSTFQKISRVVRDLSKKIAKPVQFTVIGEETELDKTVVDRLGDPLVHMVRNALDHGIESPSVRTAIGKPAEGTVVLRAFHQGGNVHIELTDDGKGLDRHAILAKAIERGLVQPGQNLTDAEVFGLIFEPGFSTAKVVTDVSGRGVGMDVVRRNVEGLQGSIQIRSQHGKGTTFTIRLPLTLAILDGLSVSLRDEVYILPLLSVIESFQPRSADVHTVAGQGEVVVVRGEAVPLLRLYRLLGRPARVSDPRHGLVVLVENQGQKYALLVDELLGQLQVVMKSLDVNFHKVEGIAGATILGDGRVAMILDVYGLTRLAQMTGRGRAGDSLEVAGRA